MKGLFGFFLFFAFVCAFSHAQSQPAGPLKELGAEERMFFPKDMFWGWAQFDLAPPHNEIDPNICAGNAGQYGGVNAPCSMFARYMLSGMLEVRPFGRGQLRRFMVFGAPSFLFGKTIPQTLYTWSPDAITGKSPLQWGSVRAPWRYIRRVSWTSSTCGASPT